MSRPAAKDYVEKEMKNNRPALDAAFRRMLQKSPDRLVNAFVDLMQDGDLDLDLDMTITRRRDE